MKDHYDVGILGVWYGCNYGSIATYYALQQTIEKLGYSTLMVHYPRLKPDDGRMKGRHSIRFAEEHYDISPSYHVSEIGELNQYCDAFVLGSDHLWNYGVTKIFGHSYFLDFAGDKFYPGEGLMPSQCPCYIPNVLPVPGMGSFYDIIPWGSTCILGA